MSTTSRLQDLLNQSTKDNNGSLYTLTMSYDEVDIATLYDTCEDIWINVISIGGERMRLDFTFPTDNPTKVMADQQKGRLLVLESDVVSITSDVEQFSFTVLPHHLFPQLKYVEFQKK